MDFDNLKTVKQLAEGNPAFTEASLRWLIYRAHENGLDEVIVRVGRRVLFDMERFEDWLEDRRQARLTSQQEESARSSWQPPRSYVAR